MYSREKLQRNCYCTKLREHHPHAILFNILNHEDSWIPGNCLGYSSIHNCHCQQQKLVRLRNPERTCQAASAVLLKTVCFMKNLPSFQNLLCRDQFLLFQSCWVPLFLLGLVQESVVFEVTDKPPASILRNILLNDQKKENSPPTLTAVFHLKSVLNKIWSLDLSPKEYAYLKGTLLFNSDISDLINHNLIQGLHKEAQRALYEVVQTLHPQKLSRFTNILLTASSLHTVTQSFITELFFKPVAGQTDFNKLLMEILFS